MTATAAAQSEARAKARVSQQLRRRLWRRLRRGWRARAWVTAAATAAARGADTPAMRAALDILARLPADNDDDDKFTNVGGGGGGGGGGWGTGGGMIIDLRSVPAASARSYTSNTPQSTSARLGGGGIGQGMEKRLRFVVCIILEFWPAVFFMASLNCDRTGEFDRSTRSLASTM